MNPVDSPEQLAAKQRLIDLEPEIAHLHTDSLRSAMRARAMRVALLAGFLAVCAGLNWWAGRPVAGEEGSGALLIGAIILACGAAFTLIRAVSLVIASQSAHFDYIEFEKALVNRGPQYASDGDPD